MEVSIEENEKRGWCFPVLDLIDTANNSNVNKRTQPYRKCRSFNLSKVDVIVPEKNNVKSSRTLQKRSINETSKNIEDTKKRNEIIPNSEENNFRKNNSTLKRKIKIDIGKMLMETKSMKTNISQVSFDEKQSSTELTCSNNSNVKTSYPCSSCSSETQTENNCEFSSPTLDTLTDNNTELIQRMIANISEQVCNTRNNILTLQELTTLSSETNISSMDKLCIYVYLKRRNHAVHESVMFKLVHLMKSKKYENISRYILGMEIFQSLNDTGNEKFKFLCSKLEGEIYKFLELNEVEILERFVDYVICTFDCRKKKT